MYGLVLLYTIVIRAVHVRLLRMLLRIFLSPGEPWPSPVCLNHMLTPTSYDPTTVWFHSVNRSNLLPYSYTIVRSSLPCLLGSSLEFMVRN